MKFLQKIFASQMSIFYSQIVITVLLSILTGLHGDNTYKVTHINQVSYGQPIGSLTARSIVECYIACSKLETCRSVMYDKTLRTCYLNSLAVSIDILTCTDETCASLPMVYYGVNADSISSFLVQDPNTTCPTSISNSCVADADCVDSNSECRDLKCKCVSGLSHDPNTCACVTDCDVYGDTYSFEIYGHLPDHNRGTQLGITLEECMDVCINESDFVCRSIEFRVPAIGMTVCRLQEVTNYGLTLRSLETCQLYTRNCA